MPQRILGAISKVIQLLKLFEAMKIDEAVKQFTENSYYRFGNAPPAVGREAISQLTKSSHFAQIIGLSFDIRAIWEQNNIVICEMEISYTRTDGRILTLPFTDIFHIEGNLVREMRIYIDPSPLFT
jgi:limonene-1,2-epoxide hydrolase